MTESNCDIELLGIIIRDKEISFYDLVELMANQTSKNVEEIFDIVAGAIYSLAGRKLVNLNVVESEDGNETMIRPTENGKIYLKIKSARG